MIARKTLDQGSFQPKGYSRFALVDMNDINESAMTFRIGRTVGLLCRLAKHQLSGLAIHLAAQESTVGALVLLFVVALIRSNKLGEHRITKARSTQIGNAIEIVVSAMVVILLR